MSDPRRILDRSDAGADAQLGRALLRAARAHTPPPEARRGVEAALGLDDDAVSAASPAYSRSRASDWRPPAAPSLLFGPIFREGGAVRRHVGPGALTAAVHAAALALALLVTARAPSAPPAGETRALVQLRAPAASAPEPGVLPFGEGMTPPRFLEGPAPAYTREAREAHVEGTVLAKCVITRAGTLERCRVIEPLPFLEEAAIDALAHSRYAPATLDGRPIDVEYVVPVRFALR